MTTTHAKPQPPYRTRLPRWPWLTITAAVFGVVGFAAGAVATSDADPKLFVPTVQDAYPETEGHAEDVLGYGYAVCAGLADGRSEAQVAAWLAGTPYEHLGIDGDAGEFGAAVVDVATATLCDGEG